MPDGERGHSRSRWCGLMGFMRAFKRFKTPILDKRWRLDLENVDTCESLSWPEIQGESEGRQPETSMLGPIQPLRSNGAGAGGNAFALHHQGKHKDGSIFRQCEQDRNLFPSYSEQDSEIGPRGDDEMTISEYSFDTALRVGNIDSRQREMQVIMLAPTQENWDWPPVHSRGGSPLGEHSGNFDSLTTLVALPELGNSAELLGMESGFPPDPGYHMGHSNPQATQYFTYQQLAWTGSAAESCNDMLHPYLPPSELGELSVWQAGEVDFQASMSQEPTQSFSQQCDMETGGSCTRFCDRVSQIPTQQAVPASVIQSSNYGEIVTDLDLAANIQPSLPASEYYGELSGWLPQVGLQLASMSQVTSRSFFQLLDTSETGGSCGFFEPANQILHRQPGALSAAQSSSSASEYLEEFVVSSPQPLQTPQFRTVRVRWCALVRLVVACISFASCAGMWGIRQPQNYLGARHAKRKLEGKDNPVSPRPKMPRPRKGKGSNGKKYGVEMRISTKLDPEAGKIWLGTFDTREATLRARDVGTFFCCCKKNRSFNFPESPRILSCRDDLIGKPFDEEKMEELKALASQYAKTGLANPK